MKYQIKKIENKNFNQFWPVFAKTLLKNFTHIPLKQRKKLLNAKWSAKTFKKRFKVNKILILTAQRKKEIIAYLVSSIDSGGISLLRWIWVKPDFRRQGIAKELMQKWQKWAKKRNCHKLRLISVEKNKKFYLRLGFKKEGIMKKDRYKKDYYMLAKIIS